MTQVRLVDLTKEYPPDGIGVANLNLTIEDGELMVLLGSSGCGKTTTLRMIAGLTQPTAGDILFDDQSVVAWPPEKRVAGMVFQQHALFPFMSVGDNVAFGLKLRKLDQMTIGQRVSDALNAVQLSGYEARWPDQLSGGQQQRVALARVLAIQPNILLLDEPLSHLDRSLREELREVIRTVQRQQGITTLFVTHDQMEAVMIADRIAVIFDGQLQQVAPPLTFYENPANTQISQFFGGIHTFFGTKDGQQVNTSIGALNIPQSNLPDGDVLLTIREMK